MTLTIAFILTVSYVGLLLFAFLLANRMIFPAPPASYPMADSIRQIAIGVQDWTVPIEYHAVDDSPLLILFSHGNGEDLGSIRPRVQDWVRQGFSVLAYEYPGYGLAHGTPSAAHCNAAVLASYRYAIDELGWRPDQIVAYGRSLGGGPSLWLAAREPVAAVILEGTFTSTFRVVTRVRMLPWDVYDNLAEIRRVNKPVLLLHGTYDEVVPFLHGPQLYAAAAGPVAKLWVDGGRHNDLPEAAGELYWKTIRIFLRTHVLTQ
jgi:abhydrolase domain-containing protein 17